MHLWRHQAARRRMGGASERRLRGPEPHRVAGKRRSTPLRRRSPSTGSPSPSRSSRDAWRCWPRSASLW